MTEEELSVVDARAEREGKTRSKIIREALAESGA
ncbi:MAG: ribbon-helix-helix protein, CopG family [Arthrobacter sp.]|nr:ribbon-helix-helix protein, CopG family [Micrococcaceae bacterium]